MTTDASVLHPYRRLLGERTFRLWFSAALSAGLGDWLGLFALQVLVVSLSDPGTSMALFGLGAVMMAKLAPSVLFGPAAGVVADRLDRKRLMVAANLGRTGLFVVIAFTRDIWVLLALVFAVECLTILFIAAKNGLLPHLVEHRDLTEANQLTLLVTYGPLPFGAAIAAIMSWLSAVIARLGLEIAPVVAALLLNASTFAIAALLIMRMRLGADARRSARDEEVGAIAQLRDGLRFVVDRPVIRALNIGVVGVFFGAGVVIALGPEFVRADLGRPAEDWFGLMTVVGAGLLVGMAAATLVAQRVRKELAFAAALVPAAALVIVVAALPGYRLVQVAGFLLALSAGTAFVLGFTLLHERTPDELRGRAFATFYTVARVAMFAALSLAPFLGGVIGSGEITAGGTTLTYSGVRVTVALGGLVGLAGAIPALVGMVRHTDPGDAEHDDAHA